MASAQSACHTGAAKLSHVVRAMAIPEAFAGGAVRLSLGIYTTEADVDKVAALIAGAVAKLASLRNEL